MLSRISATTGQLSPLTSSLQEVKMWRSCLNYVLTKLGGFHVKSSFNCERVTCPPLSRPNWFFWPQQFSSYGRCNQPLTNFHVATRLRALGTGERLRDLLGLSWAYCYFLSSADDAGTSSAGIAVPLPCVTFKTTSTFILWLLLHDWPIQRVYCCENTAMADTTILR
jgi:hypothetical protein